MRSLLAAMLFALGLLTALCASTRAGDATAPGGIAVTSAWARATPGGATTAAIYATIAASAGADRLVGVATPAAARAEIHSHTMEDGVMKMRPVSGLDVPAAGSVVLAPGGFHIMLFDIARPLQAGETVPVTFTFEKAGPIAVQAKVEALGATAPAGDAAEHQHHP
jgi:periplasmic copper chaperone A